VGKSFKRFLDELSPGEASPGEVLRFFRKREGFTLKDMESITGIKEQNLSSIENGKIKMTQHYAEIFAAALKVKPTAFLYPNGAFALSEMLIEIEKKADKFRAKMG
jgi:transcriptional regulator with XRE-family HTH domain